MPKLFEAIQITFREVTTDKGTRAVLLLGVFGTALLSGVFFAIEDFAGLLFLVLTYGSLLGGVFLAAVISHAAGFDPSREYGFFASPGMMLMLLIFIGTIFAAGFYASSYIPVVDKQLQWVFRER